MPEQARVRQPSLPSQVVGGFVHVRGVPVHDRGDDQVPGHDALLLSVVRPVANAALGMGEYPRRHRRGEKTRPASGSAAAGSGDGFGRAQTHRSRSVARSSGQTARYRQGNGLQTRRRYARRDLCALNVILGTNLPMTPSAPFRVMVFTGKDSARSKKIAHEMWKQQRTSRLRTKLSRLGRVRLGMGGSIQRAQPVR